MTASLLTAFVVGLLGGVHCVGMCGGIVATLTLGLPPAQRRRGPLALLPHQLGYNLGRIAGYTVMGLVAGGVGGLLVQSLAMHWTQRGLYLLSAVFMIALGLYLGGWWRGLAWVERAGGLLWRRLEPLGRRLLPIRSWWQALGVGFIWAWLPCGLVYSVLILALGAGGALPGGLLMLAFGLGTLPNLLGIGLLAGGAARYAELVWFRRLAGLLVIGFGLYALWQLFAA
ncbi:sulfite exporter TauE/SafE family protein [Thiohalocapsa marina]|uniref:Sulfite exporter TauE/SafE family protein n=1 Tax=Thiohalocapsa marina TaxID=424902 RepID=A0A5M8FMT6_9GAMM|nr:sulfite exporter TauE/SafE family protein [Thiohalocapsa marina]KAA6185310.1 sulfite exporter TauE/SafE family protein [Thiohalocapsa marina]